MEALAWQQYPETMEDKQIKQCSTSCSLDLQLARGHLGILSLFSCQEAMSDALQVEPSHMTVERFRHQQFSLRSSMHNCKVTVGLG